MPIFEYSCECGHKFEILILNLKRPEETLPCESCGKPAQKILFNKTSFNSEYLKYDRLRTKPHD